MLYIRAYMTDSALLITIPMLMLIDIQSNIISPTLFPFLPSNAIAMLAKTEIKLPVKCSLPRPFTANLAALREYTSTSLMALP
jgi:hypothetical protein